MKRVFTGKWQLVKTETFCRNILVVTKNFAGKFSQIEGGLSGPKEQATRIANSPVVRDLTWAVGEWVKDTAQNQRRNLSLSG